MHAPRTKAAPSILSTDPKARNETYFTSEISEADAAAAAAPAVIG